MERTLNRRAVIGLVIVGVAAGAALAATGGHGRAGAAAAGKGLFVRSRSGVAHGAFGGDHRGPSDDLDAAATYLGLTSAELQTQLQAGKTLAQIATATSGKTTDGLVGALVAAEKTELAAAVSAGRLTQAQVDAFAATLTPRFTDLVNGVRPAGPPGGFGHGGHGPAGGDELDAAATYLGLTPAALEAQLGAGKTLAQVAGATSGKTTDGLVAALVAAEKTELAAAVTAGRLTQAQADTIAGTLTQRVTDLVNGVRPAHGPEGHPGFFGGAPPSGPNA